jgi:hypothetical protein
MWLCSYLLEKLLAQPFKGAYPFRKTEFPRGAAGSHATIWVGQSCMVS